MLTRPDGGGERGQASVELLAAVPLLLLTGAVALQLSVAGYALTLADGAAEAGSLALVAGLPPGPAVRAALPDWAKEDIQVEARNGRITVRHASPSPFEALSRGLTVSSTAVVTGPG